MFKNIMSTSKKRWVSVTLLGFVAMLVGATFGFASGYSEHQGLDLDGLIWMAVPLSLLLSALAFWVGAKWMRSIDEAAQEAHKWSWYWGGSAGLGFAMVGFFLSFLPQSSSWTFPTLSGGEDPMSYAVTGGVFVVGLLMAGYVVAWAIWWFQRR